MHLCNIVNFYKHLKKIFVFTTPLQKAIKWRGEVKLQKEKNESNTDIT